ncbi:MAG: threonine synthase [Anaerolineae bacterium]|nr:threonine synthase [Anaerolineae bacterium]MDW8068035.1 threonine synthase [Anaerolineae bacterium]
MRSSLLTHLECSLCGRTYEADRLWQTCPDCDRPLLARYDLEAARRLSRQRLIGPEPSLWCYQALLPVRDPAHILTLGEGGTPLLHARRLGAELSMPHLYIKEESLNPTGSFKARGLAVAISRALELGVRGMVIPSAGNAAGAAAAYAARAGLHLYVFMPRDVPAPFLAECRALGAEVVLVDGLITECAREARRLAQEHGWLDLSTLREPYRLEGKKTMGYELARQMRWELPDVILYPTGGGTGLVGMWKAFEEMAQLGWIGERRPRMVAVQSTGCAPIVRAFHAGDEFAAPWDGAQTVAAGLRVPAAVGDFLILRTLRASGGTAIAVPDEALLEAQQWMGRKEGIFACPEGGATLAALKVLRDQGWIDPEERVVLFNTGSGLKYLPS